MSVILGVDISSTISGYAVVEQKSGKLLETSAVDTRYKYDDLYEKVEPHKKEIEQLNEKYDIEYVFVEAALKSFSSGFTSPSTLGKLSSINGIVRYLLWKETDLKPEKLNVRSARKNIGLTVSQDSDTKEQVLEFIDEQEEDFEYSLTYADNPKPASFDQADAVVMVRAGEKQLEET